MNKVLQIAAVFSFIIVLSTCSNPFESKEQGTFTINLGSGGGRAASYPPAGSPGATTGAPAIAELKHIVTFSPLSGGSAKTFTASGSATISGSIDPGDYKITMEAYLLSDGSLYARGVAVDNPVTINNPALKGRGMLVLIGMDFMRV